MVLVTVGNATQAFPRLLEAVDRLAGDGLFCDKPILMQSGHAGDFRAKHCEQRSFLTMEEFETVIRRADLVISHAGAGTLFHVLQAGKVPVVMPRRKQYGEHVDDHQIELVQALSAEGRVIPAYEPADLREAISKARRLGEQSGRAHESGMQCLVAKAIAELLEAQS